MRLVVKQWNGRKVKSKREHENSLMGNPIIASQVATTVLVRRSDCASHTCSFDAHVHPVSLCGGKSSWSCRDAWIMRRCIQRTVCTSVFYEQSTLLLLDNSVFSCAIACMYLVAFCGHRCMWTPIEQRFHRDSRFNFS